MIELILCFLTPFLFSYLLTSRLLGTPGIDQASFYIFKFNLALGLTFGISSCSFFLWLFFVGAPENNFKWLELTFFGSLILGLVLLSTFKKFEQISSSSYSDTTPSLLTHILLACVLVTLATRLTHFVHLSFNRPFGDQDAIITWNLRARFLFFGLDNWKEYFTEKLASNGQPDYPLLLPSSIARAWTYLGTDSQFIPIGIAMLFTFAAIGIIGSTVAILRGTTQGILAALVLLGTPFFIEHGAMQYADIPIAFFFLSTIALFCLCDFSDVPSKNVLILAGISAGCAAWTKNEGVMFLGLSLLIRFIVIASNKGLKIYFQELKHFTQGLFPILLILILFKTQIAPSTTLFLSQGVEAMLSKLQDPANYFEVGAAFLKKFVRFGHPGLSLFIIYGFLLGLQKFKRPSLPFLTPLLVILGMLIGYAFVIITTPFYGITYQLATAWDRLWIQLWPCVVLLFFLLIQTPEEALGKNLSGSDTHKPPTS